jgi:ABC-type branched-subunit amino acid transport system substrate-binding protein
MHGVRCWPGWFMIILVVFLWVSATVAQEVRLVYVGPTQSAVWRGVQQGLEEANILGRFTGQTYTLQHATPEGVEHLQAAQSPVAVLAAADAETLSRLSGTLAPTGLAVFNLTSDTDALRRACLPNLLHIPPSARMKADAVAQWQQKHPGAQVEARAWHPDFKKFAARDLNKRFLKIQGVPMEDDAWAGWAAVKMLAESVARTQTTEPPRLLSYMRGELQFDGQKGVSHSFRDTGQLRQPLLLVQHGTLVGEAPVRGVASSLDSLGLPSCPR